MKKNAPEIHALRQDIERHVNQKICTPADFDYLANAIWEQLHQYISATTLKRLWGYISGSATVRHSTLSILAQFVGYDHWEQYIQHLAELSEIESDAFLGQGVRSEQLSLGDCVEVSWQPNRCCVFRYLGDMRFVVERAENSKLHVGDTFNAACFLIGQPMYLDRLKGQSIEETSYVAGKRNGLTTAFVIENDSFDISPGM